jgi:RNA polymerase sigma-70 factor (ECF subfamily)
VTPDDPAAAAPPAAAEPTDRALAVRARSGDEAAFRELVRRHQAVVHRIVYRILRNADDAADVAQITFVRAFRSLHRWKEEFDFHPWLYRIAVNAALTQLDRRRREPNVDVDEVPERFLPRPPHEESPLETVGRRETLARLEKALDTLAPEFRVVFLLRVVEGLSYEEIARTLDIPRGTVMSRLSRAREALRRQLV